LITIDIGINNDVNVYYVCALHWWMMFCTLFAFACLIEYAVAISWGHFTNDKKAAHAANGGVPNNLPKGHYFGNKGLFYVAGRIDDKILNFAFGPVDFLKDPMMRNKVDYNARIFFPAFYLLFVLIYIFSSVCPWAVEYNW
jgi:hypothetical protein